MDTGNHWSDCSLHRGPAKRPGWCDCGGVDVAPGFWDKFAAFVGMSWLYLTRRL